jgi:hypothetical protein
MKIFLMKGFGGLVREVEIPGKGIGLCAAVDIGVGTVVLSEAPCGFSVSPDLASRVCQWCCNVCDDCFSQPVSCLSCHSHYCSIVCKEADQHECAVLSAFLKHREELEMGSDDETFLLCLLSLLDSRASMASLSVAALSGEEEDASLHFLFEVATRLCEEAKKSLPVGLAEWTKLCEQEENNSFGLFDASNDCDDLYCFGRAVYARASRFNHSCTPNVTRVRSGRSMVFVTARPICAGEELCITYTSLGLPKQQRHLSLQADYGFDCQCPRCVGLDDDPAAVCDRCGGETLVGLCVHHDREQLLKRFC